MLGIYVNADYNLMVLGGEVSLMFCITYIPLASEAGDWLIIELP